MQRSVGEHASPYLSYDMTEQDYNDYVNNLNAKQSVDFESIIQATYVSSEMVTEQKLVDDFSQRLLLERKNYIVNFLSTLTIQIDKYLSVLKPHIRFLSKLGVEETKVLNNDL